ncbi:MAG TPA: surface-adhesin E family protein [Burkholderiales bacterium]|nr:surface-adhesin E family protein [Burkholderiales bacterium]
MGEVKKSTHIFMSATTVYFVDPSMITRDGSLRRVWEIHNLPDTGPSGERSILASVEYDCAEKRMRTLSATGHSEPMASGQIIALRNVLDDWTNLSAGKGDQVFMKILDMACAP